MATYAISDLHGCYEEFMALLEQIKFNSDNDVIYILGDVIDRGDKPIDCLNFIRKAKHIHLLMGNHEVIMLDYYDRKDRRTWLHNGCESTIEQLNALSEAERNKIFAYVRKRPYYKTITVNGRRYFLSHAGLDISLPFTRQTKKTLTWSRDEFYREKALNSHICIFGHTPTPNLNTDLYVEEDEDERENCSIWLDNRHNDKICIDCGCVFGGALSALRLDDGAVFYVESKRGEAPDWYGYNNDPVPTSFLDGNENNNKI
jgi:serine/threonine protein phosphatase 1